ncbi:MAG: hypothetical protein ACYSO0_08230, partial [Planctomycetota bacterium]
MTEETKHKEQEQDGTLEERREIAIDRRKSVVDRRSSFDRRRGPGHRRTPERRAAEEGEMNEEQFEFLMAIDE